MAAWRRWRPRRCWRFLDFFTWILNEPIAHDLEPIRRRVRFLDVRFGMVMVQVPPLVGLNVVILLDQHPHDALVERLVRREVVANVDVDRARDVGDRVVLRQDLGTARQVQEGQLLRRRRRRRRRVVRVAAGRSNKNGRPLLPSGAKRPVMPVGS